MTLNVSLLLDEEITKYRKVHLTNEVKNVFFEPPSLSRIIRLQTLSDGRILLCEVEAYGTGMYMFIINCSHYVYSDWSMQPAAKYGNYARITDLKTRTG